MYTVDHTFGYRSQKLIKSSVHAAVPKSEAETRKVMDGSPLTRKVAHGRRVAIQGWDVSPSMGYRR